MAVLIPFTGTSGSRHSQIQKLLNTKMDFHFFNNLRFASFACLLVFLAISSSANAENMTEPRRNDNLSPFQAWRSAVECMFNKSIACTEQQQIWLNITIEVAEEDMRGYCRGGCLEHTMDVLDCIDDVKRDFWFANNFDTRTLRSFLNERCSNSTGFSYKDVPTTTSGGGAIQVPNNMVLSVIIPVLASILSYNYYF